MNLSRTLGLVAMALGALAGMAGSASATYVTSPPGTTYTGPIVAEGETVTLTGPFGFGTITCHKSKAEGKVERHGTGVTAAGVISKLTFEECTGGEVTSPVVKPGSIEAHGDPTTGDGTITSLNADVTIHKTLLGTCTFTTSSTGTDIGTLTGSNNTKGKATLDISATIPGTCGSGALEGGYVVVTPSTLEIH